MAQFAVETFTGADSTELSAHNAAWSKQTGVGINAAISNGARLRTTDAFNIMAYQHSGAPATANYSVSCDLVVLNTFSYYVGPTARASTSAHTLYMCRNAALANNQLFKCIAGTYTQLGGDVAATMVLNDSKRIKLEAIGTAIKVYWDGSATAMISVTDGDITAAGKAGLWFYGSGGEGNASGIHMDNFSGDDAAGGTTFTRALTVVAASTATMSKALIVAKLVSAVSVAGAVLNKTAQLLKTLNAASVAIGTVVKLIRTSKSVIVVSTATIGVLKVVLTTLAAISTATAARSLRVAYNLSVVVSATASSIRALSLSKQLTTVVTSFSNLLRQMPRQLAATVTSSSTMIVLKASLRTLTATAGSVATMASGIRKTLSTVSTVVATHTRRMSLTFAASVASTATATLRTTRSVALTVVSATITVLTSTYISASSMIRNVVAVTATFMRKKLASGLFQRKKNNDTEF